MVSQTYFCQSIPRRQAGSLVPCALWWATHSQHFPWRRHPSFVQGQGDDLTLDYKQFDSTPLGGIDLPVSAQPKDILNIVVNYANNRTEDYFDIQIRLLSDEGNSTRINVSAVKEGESAFPYMYIDAENPDFSPKYLLRQLKQLLPDQEWRYTYMDDAEVIHNQEEL